MNKTKPHDRNVYILGAGFSQPAGAPLVRDFLDRSREFMDDPSSGLDETERTQFRDVFNFREVIARAREKVLLDLDDLEQLFGLIEVSQRLGVGPADIKTRESMGYLIAKTLELAINRKGQRGVIAFTPNQGIISKLDGRPYFRNVSGNEFRCDMYDLFAALVGGLLDFDTSASGFSDSIISFNYDLVVDDALNRLGFTPNYYLPIQHGTQSGGRSGIPVLKLHGSSNWGICGGCRKFNSIVVFDNKVTADPNRFRLQPCPNCGPGHYQPLLIPPTWHKGDYLEIVRDVWAEAVRRIMSATRICIIGYSMPETDSFFKYLLSLALSENHGLYRLIAVDKKVEATDLVVHKRGPANDGPTLPQKYERLLDRLFAERRFSYFDDGLYRFLSKGGSFHELGRGSAIRDGQFGAY